MINITAPHWSISKASFQLPPSLTLNPKRRVIEKYKRALFTRHIGSVNLKNEIKKLMEASKDIVDLSFSASKPLQAQNDYKGL